MRGNFEFRYNITTTHISVPYEVWTEMDNPLEYKPKGPILQGGIGYYSLCRDCNSFLGLNYVKAYEKLVSAEYESL
ncbi:MAG: hypothetical protein SGJ10_09480 [Bacteroidota bacterium]|nr:hypothetical protein [Bacteroidota bacterium]